MGSIGRLGTASAEFATNSGSTLADMGTLLPSLVLRFLDALLEGIAHDVVSSVGD
ncbi:hypothetical protein G6016_01480 [Dietzia aerolata]|uniref:Uncharacterized protein n=1 Tax=Dietzia aerolata TaxID=595984 RepID=A0ABV5JN84_9ACTN|nr:hypothetical protein [Dietzia aerolata]MBB0967651.1 hypothetical protein [Dietzia aerolata]